MDPPTEPASWHFLTGEYPPGPGGIGDHTALVASALAAAGRKPHVWTNGTGGVAVEAGVTVHRALGAWSGAPLSSLGRALDSWPAPRRLLVQYAPNVWGKRGLNLEFCRWLGTRAALGDDVRPVFHELWYEFDPRDRPTRWAFPVVQRRMARLALEAGRSAYVSTPAWADKLRSFRASRSRSVVWLPVPSNVPVARDPGAVSALRAILTPDGRPVVGSFGTYHGAIADALAGALPRVGPGPAYLLMGRGSVEFAGRLGGLPGVRATGPLDPRGLSLHLQACDLLVQPYPDGATARRGSLMAPLAHGRAVVTTAGRLSEPVWAGSGGVALAPAGDADALARLARCLLDDPDGRDRLAARGLALYESRFALECVVRTLTAGGEPL